MVENVPLAIGEASFQWEATHNSKFFYKPLESWKHSHWIDMNINETSQTDGASILLERRKNVTLWSSHPLAYCAKHPPHSSHLTLGFDQLLYFGLGGNSTWWFLNLSIAIVRVIPVARRMQVYWLWIERTVWLLCMKYVAYQKK